MWEMPFTMVSVTAPIIYTTLKAGFNMIATIAVIAAITEKKFSDRGNHSDHMETSFEIELKSISATVVGAIAEEWFPYDHCDRWTFFSAIVVVIWKPTFNWRLLQISQFKKNVFLFYEKI